MDGWMDGWMVDGLMDGWKVAWMDRYPSCLHMCCICECWKTSVDGQITGEMDGVCALAVITATV